MPVVRMHAGRRARMDRQQVNAGARASPSWIGVRRRPTRAALCVYIVFAQESDTRSMVRYGGQSSSTPPPWRRYTGGPSARDRLLERSAGPPVSSGSRLRGLVPPPPTARRPRAHGISCRRLYSLYESVRRTIRSHVESAAVSLSGFDTNTREVLFQVFAVAWRELAATGRVPPSENERNKIRQQVSRQLIAAAATGERDFERLKAKAIDGV